MSVISSSVIKLFGATILQSNNQDQRPKKSDDDGDPTADKRPDKIIPCPRCKSMETKFCYFNNYNVNQPRHFCKGCQRYWTAGGALRNVPVGAGRRKAKSPGRGGMTEEFSDGCVIDASEVERMGLFGVGEWLPAAERGGFGNLFTAKRRRRGFDGQGEEEM